MSDHVLRHVIARAASPSERAAYPAFRRDPAGGDGKRARWADDWARAAAGGPDGFRSLLAFRGVSHEMWQRGLDDVIVADGPGTPPWANDLRALFGPSTPVGPPIPPLAVGDVVSADTARTLGLGPDDTWPLHAAFEPLLRLAAARLARAIRGASVPIAPDVARQMLAQLAQRWSIVAMPVLVHRVQLADLLSGIPGAVGTPLRAVFFGDERPPREQWLDALAAFPVLGRLLAVTYRFWLDAMREMIGRLRHDWRRLGRVLGSGASLGALTGFRGDAGDMHDHGRSVSILTFATGARVVYKPKDLRIAGLYDEMVELLNTGGLSPRLHRRAIVHGHGYAWEEFVAAAPCASEAGVRRFYRRMGMHVRLVQLLDGVDFTADNVVAHGEWPVLIDLEMLLSPRMPPSVAPTATEREVLRRVFDSPCRSGLISAKIIGDAGRRPAEVGALAAGEQRIAPFKQRVLRRTDEGDHALADDYVPFAASTAAPILDGATARADRYFDEVVRGYRDMHRCLWRAKRQLLTPGGILDRLADVRVRFLCRDTHVYSRLLVESWHPTRMRDAVAREICLERLWRGRFADPGVVQQEVDAARDLDVPMFTARAGDDTLATGAAREIRGFFDGNPVARVRDRLAALPPAAGRRDIDTIDTVLFTLAPDAAPRSSPARRRRARHDPRAPLAVAASIGDSILRHAVSADDGQLGWHGLHYHWASDSWELGVLNDDILTGTAGLAIVFADLARATGRARFASAARTLAGMLARRLDTPLAPPTGGATGGMTGWGAWLYAILRVASALEDWRAVPPLLAPLANTAPDAMALSPDASLVTGLAGLVRVLVRATHAPGGHALWPHACRAGHALLERRDASGSFPEMVAPDDATTLAGLPDAQFGAAAALLSLARRRLTPGFELATTDRHALESMRAAHHRAAAKSLRSVDPTSARTGDLVTASETAIMIRDHDRASTLAQALTAVHRRAGRWFPDSYAADRFRPSAILGTGAITHALLRVHDPSIRSIRLLA